MTSGNRDPLGYYAMLAVPPDASMHEIRLAFERAVAVANANRMPFIAELASTAYKTLSDEIGRRSYDSGYNPSSRLHQTSSQQYHFPAEPTQKDSPPQTRRIMGSVAGFDNGEGYKPKSWWEKLLD
jgi:curved DNA-binding protein CbpA